MISKACELKRKKKVKGSSLTLEQRRRTFDLVEKGGASLEAQLELLDDRLKKRFALLGTG